MPQTWAAFSPQVFMGFLSSPCERVQTWAWPFKEQRHGELLTPAASSPQPTPRATAAVLLQLEPPEPRRKLLRAVLLPAAADASRSSLVCPLPGHAAEPLGFLKLCRRAEAPTLEVKTKCEQGSD